MSESGKLEVELVFVYDNGMKIPYAWEFKKDAIRLAYQILAACNEDESKI